MRRFRTRKATDGMANELRQRSGRFARWIYVGGLVALFAWLGDIVGGKYLYLQSEGMVVASGAIVASEFPATIRDVRVREGETAHAGDLVAELSSHQVAESIARLTFELATRRTRLADLRIRAATADAMLGPAEERARITSDSRSELEKLNNRGLLPIDRRLATMESEFRAKSDVQALGKERDAIAAELATLEPVIRHAENALARLEAGYRNGAMVAPINGTIGRVHVVPGTVVKPGDPLIELHGYDHYVLAYVPAGSFYDVAPGDRVRVRWGVRSTTGHVVKVDPVAMALPREFQRAFKPIERAQVIRVEFDGDARPPLFAKVDLSSSKSPLAWVARTIAALEAIGGARAEVTRAWALTDRHVIGQ